MYKLKRNEKVLFENEKLKDVMFYFLSIESNIYHSLAYKGYAICLNDNIVEVTSDQKHDFEYEYNKELYIKRVNKIMDIIKALNLKHDISSDRDIKEYGYMANNIRVYAITEKNQYIAFEMVYNNKNKITVSTYWKRDNENNYVEMEKLSISFSFDKDINKIIKDINKRFMPHYKELEKIYFDKIANINNGYNKIYANMEFLKGEKLTENEKKSYTLYPKIEDVKSITISQDSCRIDLYSLPIEKAKKILDILKSLMIYRNIIKENSL